MLYCKFKFISEEEIIRIFIILFYSLMFSNISHAENLQNCLLHLSKIKPSEMTVLRGCKNGGSGSCKSEVTETFIISPTTESITVRTDWPDRKDNEGPVFLTEKGNLSIAQSKNTCNFKARTGNGVALGVYGGISWLLRNAIKLNNINDQALVNSLLEDCQGFGGRSGPYIDELLAQLRKKVPKAPAETTAVKVNE